MSVTEPFQRSTEGMNDVGPTAEEILEMVEAVNELDKEQVGGEPAPILTPREYGQLYGSPTPPKRNDEVLGDILAKDVEFVNQLRQLRKDIQGENHPEAPKPVARPKKDGYVTNTAFRDHEGLRNLQRDLRRAKHKNSKGTK